MRAGMSLQASETASSVLSGLCERDWKRLQGRSAFWGRSPRVGAPTTRKRVSRLGGTNRGIKAGTGRTDTYPVEA